MGNTSDFTQNDIPSGFQIFENRLTPAGISFREADAADFASSGGNGWLELEREPGNLHDEHAIKVIGCTKGFFGTKRRFVGYVPKEIAKDIVTRGFFSEVRPRLTHARITRDGFAVIEFQILGPKARKKEYEGK